MVCNKIGELCFVLCMNCSCSLCKFMITLCIARENRAKNEDIGPSKLILYPDLFSTRLCQQEIWVWDYIQMEIVNPLSPNIHIQILQTNLHTLPLRISWENLIKPQGIFSFIIIFYILTTLCLDNVWTLLGENCCWSLLGLKGLRNTCKLKSSSFIL